MIKLHHVCISRRLADLIMKEHRLDAENKLITTTKSTSVDVGVSGNIGAATGIRISP